MCVFSHCFTLSVFIPEVLFNLLVALNFAALLKMNCTEMSMSRIVDGCVGLS